MRVRSFFHVERKTISKKKKKEKRKEKNSKTHRLGHVVRLVPEDRDPCHRNTMICSLVDRIDPAVRHESNEPPVAQQVVLRHPCQRLNIFFQIQIGDGHVAREVGIGELPESARGGQEGKSFGKGPVLVGGDGDEGAQGSVDHVVGLVLFLLFF